MRWAIKPWQQFLVLFAAGFAVRAALVVYTRQYTELTKYELERAALSLANTGVLGNPYAIPTGPTAHVSPGYPIILAGIYRWFGSGQQAELVKQFFACGISAVQWALVPAAAGVLRFPRAAGLAAGLIWSVIPVKFGVQTLGDWEAPYAALGVMMLCCVMAAIYRRGAFSKVEASLSGAAWGISLLFVAAFLPVLAAFVTAGFFVAGTLRFRKYAGFVVIQLAVAAVLLSPWVIRNELQLGSAIVTRTNTGLELRLSNNDLAGPLEMGNFEHGVYAEFHPLQNALEAAKVREWGEVAYSRWALGEAERWISQHPARFVSLTGQRIFYYWFQPDPHHPIKLAWLDGSVVLTLIALLYLKRMQPYTALSLTVFLLVFPLPNYLVHVNERHRYPLDWICNLCGIFAIYVVIRKAFFCGVGDNRGS